jgi:anti-sigma regulatory factor (Ser/Thr protein kinase)
MSVLPKLEDLPETLGLSALVATLTRNSKFETDGIAQVGFMRTLRAPLDQNDENNQRWVLFRRKAQEAAEYAGLIRRTALGLAGALGELEDNIHRHSELPSSGLVGFRAIPGEFEFIVVDSGIGVLASLKQCPDYELIADAGTALRLALADGTSRFGRNTGNGFGFQGLFTGLANLQGFLRFRSGDHALTIDGRSPNLVSAKLAQRASFSGFSIFVSCRPHDT